MERYVYKIVPLAEISTAFPFAVRYSLKDPLLCVSVAKRGVLQPVLLTADKQVLSGHKRVAAARTAGLGEIPAFEISGAQNSKDFYWLAIVSNWKQALGDLDRAWVVKRALQDFKFDEKEVIEEILPALGLEPQKHFLEECMEVAALESPVLEAIAGGRLPFRGARVLRRFSPSDQIDFARLVAERAVLTSNQLLKAGEWLFDLMKLKKLPLEAIFKIPALETSLEASSQDRRQKGEKFCASLRTLRFPELARKEKEFGTLAGKIEADQPFSLEAPAFFEGEGLTLRAKLANPEALDKLSAAFARQRKLFNSLFDVML